MRWMWGHSVVFLLAFFHLVLLLSNLLSIKIKTGKKKGGKDTVCWNPTNKVVLWKDALMHLGLPKSILV
jgi:hypothetical protein